jgi:hypothetical protein
MRRSLLLVPALLVLAGAGGAGWVGTQSLPESSTILRAGRFHQTTDTMWDTVSDIADSAAWRTDLRALDRQPDVRGHEVWRETRKDGEIDTLETADEIGRRRLVRCVVDQGGPYGGCWTIEVMPRDKESVVTIQEALSIHDRLWRFTHFARDRRAALDAFLLALGQKFGETPKLADKAQGL